MFRLFILLLPTIVLTITAILIKYYKCYWLISGYNTSSKKEKEKYNTEGLGNFMGNVLFVLAGINLFGIILKKLGFELLGDLTWIVFLVIIFYLIIKSQRFYRDDHNTLRLSTKVMLLVVCIPLLFLFFIPLIYGTMPNEVYFEGKNIEITGMYGTTINTEAVTSIELIYEIPNIDRKINGFSFGHFRKGTFKLRDWGRGRIYIQSKTTPYILIKHKREGFILINFKSIEDTIEVYEMISN